MGKIYIILTAILLAYGLGIEAQRRTTVDNVTYSCDATTQKASARKTTATDAVVAASVTVDDVAYTVTEIADSMFFSSGSSKITTLSVPASVATITLYTNIAGTNNTVSPSTTIRHPFVTVATDNSNFSSDDDGVLYNKDKTKIVYFPNQGSSLTSYTVPDGVSELGDFAFTNCTNLTSIDFSKVTTMGEYVFYGCTGITTSMTWPTAVTKVPRGTFAWCRYMKSVDFTGCSVTEFGDRAFEECRQLKDFDIPSTVTTLGNSCFEYCLALTSVTLPNNITSIGEACYRNCYYITSFTLSTAMTTIPKEAFCAMYLSNRWVGTHGITSINIPDNITTIDDGAFYQSQNLNTVTGMKNVETIGKAAFAYTNIYSFTLPDRLKELKDWAFACNGMGNANFPTTISLPEHTKLGAAVFGSQDYVEKIELRTGKSDYYVVDNGILYTTDKKTLVYCPPSLFKNAKTTAPHPKYLLVVPDGVEEIYSGGLQHLDYVRHITLPKTLKTIGSGALSSKQNNTSTFTASPVDLTIPGSVTTVGDGAFDATNIYFLASSGDNLPEMGNWAYTINWTLSQESQKSGVANTTGSGGTFRMSKFLANNVYFKPSVLDAAQSKYGHGMTTSLFQKWSYPQSQNWRNNSTFATQIPDTFAVGKQYKTLGRDFDVKIADTDKDKVKLYVASAYANANNGLHEAVLTMTAPNFSGTVSSLQAGQYMPSYTGGTYTYDGTTYDQFTGAVLALPSAATAQTIIHYEIGEYDVFSGGNQLKYEGENLLTAATSDTYEETTETVGEETWYNFGLNSGKFKIYSRAGYQSYNKAYLHLPKEAFTPTKGSGNTSTTAKSVGMVFVDGEPGNTATAIKGVLSVAAPNDSATPYYNLQGQRVAHPHGGIFIHNGRKVVIK